MVSVPPRQDEQEMEVPESWYALKMGHLHCAGQSPLTRHYGVRGDKAAEVLLGSEIHYTNRLGTSGTCLVLTVPL